MNCLSGKYRIASCYKSNFILLFMLIMSDEKNKMKHKIMDIRFMLFHWKLIICRLVVSKHQMVDMIK